MNINEGKGYIDNKKFATCILTYELTEKGWN